MSLYHIAGEGLEVVEHLKDAGGVVVPKQLRHYVILGGVYADTPAQRKLSKWMSHSAYLGCGHCMMLGTWDNGMYFQGCTEERAAGIRSVVPARYKVLGRYKNTIAVLLTVSLPCAQGLSTDCSTSTSKVLWEKPTVERIALKDPTPSNGKELCAWNSQGPQQETWAAMGSA